MIKRPALEGLLSEIGRFKHALVFKRYFESGKTEFADMSFLRFVVIGGVCFSSVSQACLTKPQGQSLTKAQIRAKFATSARKPAAVIQRFAEGHGKPTLESQLGNLLLQWQPGLQQTAPTSQMSSIPSIKKVVLSIPVVIEKSSYHPFGDGQSNAKMSLGSAWKEDGFLVVGVQTTDDQGQTKRQYLFHPSLKIAKFNESSLGDDLFKVQPEGWNDSFYFSFATRLMPVAQFLAGVPESRRTFSGNRVAPDPARIGKGQGVERFLFRELGAGYNKEPWYSPTVHGLFPNENGEKTALGGVLTWGIVEKSFGPFKHLYTCFEKRDVAQEKQTGVPSGAGWHHIGDPAESLLNTLESASLPVAVARTHGRSNAAYGLTESITATWLQTDEVLVTQQGEFHWYLNPYESTVCTEIWVHGCVPNLTNNWGFSCGT